MAGAPDLPAPPLLLAVLAAIQPLLLLLAGAFAGALAAPHLGLRSLVTEWASGLPPGRPRFEGLGGTVLASVLFGLAINLIDELARPLWLPEDAAFPPYAETWSPVTLVFGALYGGITEEVMFRWGAMSLVAWLLWRTAGRPRPLPAWILAAAIGFAALLFAAGHLPAVAAIVPLSPGPALRTLLLNGLAGLWLGWIFRRRHLEAAMLSHAALHVGFALYAVSLLAVTSGAISSRG